MHSFVMTNAIQSLARAEVSVISIIIVLIDTTISRKGIYVCHMKVILDTTGEKGKLY